MNLLPTVKRNTRLGDPEFLLSPPDCKEKEMITELLKAVSRNQLSRVKELIEKGADIRFRDNFGVSVLHTASQSDSLDIIKYLIEELKFNVNDKDHNDETALHISCAGGCFETVKYLVKNGADINAPVRGRTDGNSPLDIACFKGFYEIAEFLINYGVDLSQKDGNGWTFLFSACEGGSPDIVKLLIKKGLDINAKTDDGRTLLFEVCQHGHLELFEYLLNLGLDINAKNQEDFTLLHYASQGGSLNLIKFLYNKGLDINGATKDGQTPLYIACGCGSLELVKFLAENGADIHRADSEGKTALYNAGSVNYLEVVKYLHKNGARLDDELLICCAERGYDDLAEYLLKNGVNANIKNSEGWTALHIASENGYSEKMVKLLIDYKTDLDSTVLSGEKKGSTALKLAEENDHKKIIQYLKRSV